MHKDLEKVARASRMFKRLADKYISPKGYQPWNTMLIPHALWSDVHMLQSITASDIPGLRPEHFLEAGLGANLSAALDAPAVYLSVALTESLLHTDVGAMQPPESVLPCFYICLPRNMLHDDEGVEITCLLVAENAMYAPFALAWMEGDIDKKYQALDEQVKSGNIDNLKIFAFNVNNDVICVTRSWAESTSPKEDVTPIEYSFSDEIDVDDIEFRSMSAKICRIVKNVVLIYNYKRELISTVNINPPASGFSVKKEVSRKKHLPTTILGKDFLTSKCYYTTQSTAHTDVTKKPHWRKGHWHTVLHGPGKKERKLHWFQPVYVNANLDT
jgi:hypothetical protein